MAIVQPPRSPDLACTILERKCRVANNKVTKIGLKAAAPIETDLDGWIKEYNEQRTHTGKYCFGKTPWETFLASKELAVAKMVDRNYQPA